MKLSILIAFCVLINVTIKAQSKTQVPLHSFSLNQLFYILDTLPAKDVNTFFTKNGYKLEKKAHVYVSYGKVIVKNAYELIYIKSSLRFRISFYQDKAYQFYYFFNNMSLFKSLNQQAKNAGFTILRSEGNSSMNTLGNYGLDFDVGEDFQFAKLMKVDVMLAVNDIQ